jgi:hypothetical protein
MLGQTIFVQKVIGVPANAMLCYSRKDRCGMAHLHSSLKSTRERPPADKNNNGPLEQTQEPPMADKPKIAN